MNEIPNLSNNAQVTIHDLDFFYAKYHALKSINMAITKN